MSTTTITQALVSENDHPDGFYYRATVETGTEGLCRLNVECCPMGSDEAETSQGMDLTSAECKALAQMLLGVAVLLDADAAQS
jgi:hypothetical protein